MSTSALSRFVAGGRRETPVEDALREELAVAQHRLDEVEALRIRLAEAADFSCSLDDDVRAAVMLHCAAELRAALR